MLACSTNATIWATRQRVIFLDHAFAESCNAVLNQPKKHMVERLSYNLDSAEP